VIVPVIVASTFCLSVPLILILADVAILTAALYAFASHRRAALRLPAQDLPELE
jgi:hypothetical protein